MTQVAAFPLIPRVVTEIPAVPGWPLVGNLFEFRADRLKFAQRASDLGPIARVSLGPIPIYFVSCADLAHRILVEDSGSYKKSPVFAALTPLLGDGLLTSEGFTHKHHRKLLAPAFAPRRLAAYSEAMVDEAIAQLSRWPVGGTIDLADELMQLTLAVAGRTLFAADVRGDAADVADGLELAMRSLVDGVTSLVPLGYSWPLRRHRDMRRAVAQLDRVVYRVIEDGRRHGDDRGDVLSMLLLARDDDGTGLTDQQVRDEVMTLLLAGHETTSNALAWTFYELGRDPGVRERLATEVQHVLGDRRAQVDDLAAMPFALAVIEEAMRLHPPAYIIPRQALFEVKLGRYRLPAGSLIDIHVRGIHRRADYFPDPLAFRPERMLADAKQARPRHHYMPFGAGPRVCIGAHFAMLEAHLLLATIVQRARLGVDTAHVTPEPLVTLRPRGGLHARVEQRRA